MDIYKSTVQIASINYAIKRAKRKGEINFTHAYILICIKRTINYACNLQISEQELRKLNLIYFNFMAKSLDIPVVDINSNFEKNTLFNKLRIQEITDAGLNAPTVDSYILSDNPPYSGL